MLPRRLEMLLFSSSLPNQDFWAGSAGGCGQKRNRQVQGESSKDTTGAPAAPRVCAPSLQHFLPEHYLFCQLFPLPAAGEAHPRRGPQGGGVRAGVPLLGLEEEHPWEESSVSGPRSTLSRLWWGNLPPPSPAQLRQHRVALGSIQNSSNVSSSSSEEGRSHKIREAATCFLADLDELGRLSCEKREPA